MEVEEAASALYVEEDANRYEVVMHAAEAAPPIPMRRSMARQSFSAPTASAEYAEIREVGDFSVFESPSVVTIPANRSVLVPLFRQTLGVAKTVLHYKYDNHPERPYRAVWFTNETDYSLGRGVCTVYEDDVYAGSCIMPAVKPGGGQLLPHALETGVRVRYVELQTKNRLVGIRLAKGFGYVSHRRTETTTYRIENYKKEPFRLILDHDYRLHEAEISCELSRSGGAPSPYEVDDSLRNGCRATLDLGAEEALLFTVVESAVQQSSAQLADSSEKPRLAWLESNIVAVDSPLAEEPAIRNCLALRRRLDDKLADSEAAEKEINRLIARQERLRKNIRAGGHEVQNNRWKTELGNAEERIVELEESELPKLHTEAKAMQSQLRDAVMELAMEWQAGAGS